MRVLLFCILGDSIPFCFFRKQWCCPVQRLVFVSFKFILFVMIIVPTLLPEILPAWIFGILRRNSFALLSFCEMLYFVPQFILSVSEGVSRFPVYDKHINCYVIHDSSMVQGRLTFEIKHGPQNLGDMPISCNVHFWILKLVMGIRMLLSTISSRNKPQRIFQQISRYWIFRGISPRARAPRRESRHGNPPFIEEWLSRLTLQGF